MSDLKPIEFPESNCNYAENQDEYITLPVYKDVADGLCVSCWKLSLWQRVQVLFRGRLWHHQLTYNSPLQPIVLATDNPFKSELRPGDGTIPLDEMQ